MVYYSNYATEGIVFHAKEDADDFYIIALTKNLDGEACRVEVDFDDDWYWEFEMLPGAYELVKHMIMDVAFECENGDELLMELDTLFDEVLSEIVVRDECETTCDCDHGCNHCNCKE
jgi:hypothetical protein